MQSLCILLGICNDGIPLFWNFNSRLSGSLLILGGENSENTNNIRMIVKSSIRVNEPLSYEVVTNDPYEWETSAVIKSLALHITTWETKSIEDLISSLVKEVEQNFDNCADECKLFILDDLTQVKRLDKKVQENLMWLIYYGPKAGIWSAATLNANQVFHFMDWLDLFEMRLIGKTASSMLASHFGITSGHQTETLIHGREFLAWDKGKWKKLQLPEF
jgi:hypothetical protein